LTQSQRPSPPETPAAGTPASAAGECPVADFTWSGPPRAPLAGHAMFDRLREAAPVQRVAADGASFVLVTDHAQALRVAQDAKTFPQPAHLPETGELMSFLLIPENLNGPEHTRWRRLLAPHFSPGRVASWDVLARSRAVSLIESLIDRGECDFVPDFALRFPTAVFLQIMGLPVDHLDMLLDWETRILHPAHEQEAVNRDETLGAQVAVTQYFTGVIEERRRMRAAERPEGLVTDALDWRIDGEPVSDEELLRFYLLMFMAGLDTVTAELGYGFLHLATHPQDRRRLVEDPEVIPRAVEELLRVYPIVNTPREVSRETEIAGCPVRPGDFVMISYPGAGRDESVYADARTVDFDRTGMSHLTFGAGPHRCLGSHLARHELAVAYEEWHKRIPEYRLAEDVEFTEATGGMMALNALPLRWDRP
jgi:cytochrome P450